MKKAPTKLFSLFLLTIIGGLVLVELYIGASWFSNQAIFRIESQDIIDDVGQQISYHIKTSDQSYYESYTFEVFEDSIKKQYYLEIITFNWCDIIH